MAVDVLSRQRYSGLVVQDGEEVGGGSVEFIMIQSSENLKVLGFGCHVRKLKWACPCLIQLSYIHIWCVAFSPQSKIY